MIREVRSVPSPDPARRREPAAAALRCHTGKRLPSKPMTAVGAILAHQGGWDEILMVLGPLAILFVVLLLANKRARRLAEARDAQDQAAAAVDAHADGPPPSPAG